MTSPSDEAASQALEPANTPYRSNAWTDLALTTPVFVGYHVGVVTLNVRNAADVVTTELVALVDRNLALYWALTVAIGLSMIAVLALLGRGQAFEGKRFALVAVEGVLYAIIMRFVAGLAVGALPLGAMGSRWAGVVMSMGAGFYEELAFRVGLFGLGSLALRALSGGVPRWTLTVGWAVVAAAAFSGWHYVGAMGDAWELRSFVFRFVCGLVFTAIYVWRGFAPAVWTHVLYDLWVLALR